MERTWTDTGAQLYDPDRAEREGHRHTARRLIVEAIDRLHWTSTVHDRTVPAMAGLAINTLIDELALPKVSHVAVDTVDCLPDPTDNEIPTYGFYGIRCHYSNGTAAVYAVDRGSDLVVVASDFTREDTTAPNFNQETVDAQART